MVSIDKKHKILLITVQKDLNTIGLKYIHYSLLQKGHQSYLLHLPYLDFTKDHVLGSLRDFVTQIDPIFIGLSLMSIEFRDSCRISQYLKEYFPSIPIVWGGIHPTIEPESCFPFADYICIGEGERTILDLANALICGQHIEKVLNICYRENGQLIRNALYPQIENLDDLPLLDHIPQNSYLQMSNGDIIAIDKDVYRKEARYQGQMYELMSSRGCAFSCTYCCNNFLSKLYTSKKIRRRSIEHILSELRHAVTEYPEITSIHFQDDSFLAVNEDYLVDFCLAYKTHINRPFIIHTIPTYVKRNKLRILKEAGLQWLSMGLQSGSDNICRNIYKRYSFRQDFLNAAELVNEFHIAAKYDVILDNPFESKEEQLETVETLMLTPKPYLLEFFSLTFYPGTELYEKAMKECPKRVEDSRKKDFLDYKQNTLNRLTILAIYLPRRVMKALLKLYKANDQSLMFRMFLIFSSFICFIYKPIMLFKVLIISSGHSFKKTLSYIVMYSKLGFLKYIKKH